ncbi:MAG: hypothetical protein PWQ96_2313 [Clostridia bacterium]|nr:hypothetical protein [Clostridia bacterium]
MKIINVEKIPEIIKKWQNDCEVFVPVDNEGAVDFIPWSEGSKITLEGNSLVPPKKLFFPQTETLYKYETKGQSANVIALEEKTAQRIIFGIRPCDLKSLEMLDDVFLTKGFVDPYYKLKRENTALVALLCAEACDTCFCTSMNIDPGAASGADIVACKSGEQLGLQAQTEKGEELLNKVFQLTTEGEIDFKKAGNFKLQADIEGLAEKLKEHFESPYWEAACRKCIGCGTCTYLCPTCHCFDINSNTRGDHGIKTRCWDSCMFSEYTLMAGGHNPRPGKKERFRQRFLHKLQYFPERYNKTACVGCGRCLAKCPAIVDITRIITELREVTGIGTGNVESVS